MTLGRNVSYRIKSGDIYKRKTSDQVEEAQRSDRGNTQGRRRRRLLRRRACEKSVPKSLGITEESGESSARATEPTRIKRGRQREVAAEIDGKGLKRTRSETSGSAH